MRKTIFLALVLLLAGFSYVKYTSRPQAPLPVGDKKPASPIPTAGNSPSQFSVGTGLPRRAAAVSAAAGANAISGAVSHAAPTATPSSDDGRISETAMQQIQALMEEKAARSPAQQKIDSQLLFAGKLSRNEPIAKGITNLQVELDRDQAGRVLLDIKADVSADLLAEIGRRGGQVVNSFAEYQAIRAALPLDQVENLSQRSDVRFIGPAVRAERHAGDVTSEGDIAEKANVARNTYGVTGAGVKVAVLSDSVDYLSQSQASGDLGNVTVLAGQSGVPASGEGTAMLEIVHDLAPGADLYYATAFNGVASFANNIRQLRAAGCDVIIDDVYYYNECPFQDGLIAQAVNDVTAGGALFFSSAGNSGNKNDGQSGVWEGDFADGGQLAAPLTGQGRIHSFGAANYNTATSGGSSRRVDLFWADPLGRASTDYDVYVLDSTGAQVVASSSNTQNGTQDAYEALNKLDVGQRLVIVQYSGAARFLHLGTGRGRLAISTGGQTGGHNSAVNAFCVAAVSAANATTPFTTSAKVENFSSDGLRRVFFNADGTAITPGNFSASGGTLRQKPDIAAADGVKTTLPTDSGLNPFYGTSAAAPHAGAIAALLISLRPGMITAEMRTALTTGTLDIEAAGTDRDAGYGLVMADRVLQLAGTVQPPTITGFSPASGPIGTGVTVTGTKFTGASSVQFNGVEAVFTVASGTQLSATVPAGAATGKITVITPDGTATSANNFTVSVTPAITGFTPASGNVGTVVVITGANLNGATAVSFGGTPATVFTVNNATQITATVPAGAVTGKITVTTPAGSVQSSTAFTVTALPVIAGFSPVSGTAGASVIITGANFVNVNSVTFNGVAAASKVVNSASQITAVVPAGATTGPISVSTAAGTAQSTTSFTVISAPAIAGITPANGTAGTVVTITGTGFAGATAITFNGANAAGFAVGTATQITATAPVGVTTGPVRVTTPGGTATSPVSFTVVAAAANDNFASAQVLSGNTGSTSGNNQSATKEAEEPNHARNAGGKSVWYRWTAPSSGTWTFDTVGSSFDTLLAVYTGATLGTLNAAAANDDIVNGVTTNSRVAFVASAGTAYLIAVDGYFGGTQGAEPIASGSIKLNWSLTAAVPAITGFTPASGSAGASVTITGANLTGATNVTFNGASASFTVNSATQITATVPTGATSGPLAVSTAGGTASSAQLFSIVSVAGNDLFANAFVLTGSSGTTNCSNVSATRETGEPAHAGNLGGRSVWFSWTAPANGLWLFSTLGSSFDTLLAVYTGTSVNNLTAVVSNDDWNNSQASQVLLNAVAGTTYRIAIDGFAGANGTVILNWNQAPNAPTITSFNPTNGGVGTAVIITGVNLSGAIGVKFNGVSTPAFTGNSATQITATVPSGASTGPITVTTSNGVAQSSSLFAVVGAAPANDSFAGRLTLSGATRTVTGSNQYATRETGERDHAFDAGGSSVWWTWTAPSSGTYRITTRGSDFDTLLSVYTGSSLATLVVVDENDDGENMGTDSAVTFAAVAGAAYPIAVDGYSGAMGIIVLSVYPAVASQDLYFTGFEPIEGFDTGFTLASQGGWLSSGSGQNGVAYNYFSDFSQQAYVGVSSTVNGSSQFLWYPLNVTPNTNTRPVIVFSTSMEIIDSSNSRYDDFGWDVYNQAGKRLFFLDFDNSDMKIYYRLNDGSGFQDSGRTFQNGQIYLLEVAMDFGRNRWSATLDGNPVVRSQPISATNNVALNLGDIDAIWNRSSGTYGDNFMLFDDYYVRAEPSQVPRIITGPQNQSVSVGGSASFLVAVDSSLEVTYQWQLNGANLSGADQPTLSLNNLSLSQGGNYSVIVSNTAGVVTSLAATLTVVPLPNLTAYKPSGWSDKIVVTTTAGTNVDATSIAEGQEIFVSWAVLNIAGGGNIAARFYTQLSLDGVLNYTWSSGGLNDGFYSFITGYDLGKLPAGTHTLRIDTDTTGVIPESDETDNSYTRTFVVVSTSNPPPQLSAPSRDNSGVFRLTLGGVPSRSYEIQSSSNLVNWSALATLVNTNANGILQFSDPSAAAADRRFYRSRLITP